ncbi:MAG: ABC transporter permease [Chloroflexi bacterium]|nr:ABC transporter permease [Chloroflexota bacterium]
MTAVIAPGVLADALRRHERSVRVERAVVFGGIVALGVSVLLFWQFALGSIINLRYVSTPVDVARSLLALAETGDLLQNAGVTMTEATAGYLIGVTVGLVGAFLLLTTRRGYEVLEPYVLAFYSVPKIALAPLFIMWFGLGPSPKVILAALMVFLIVFVNTVAGVRAVDRGLVDVVRVLGARRGQLLRVVFLPAAAPAIMAAVRVTFARAMVGTVLAELIASTEGLGYVIVRASRQFDVATVFAGVVVIAALVMTVNVAMRAVERRVFPWASRPVHA